ncbi:M56 family metallopeptidase [Labrenzia sp. 011]|uniref:M56 family metallopeptidase n=1 Tax=Labrenzia sp. 011 TaxID=2171494 RepID=UPI000D520E1B|nr:M56 family metallopeptidase [Labrenzia sp. 011]PVB59816.1 peptidase M50 [Labrenzia sp. 011]
MTLLNRMFDVYIDLNIILAVTALVWLTAKLVLARFGKRLTFTLQLGLLNGLFAIIVLSPAIVAAYHTMLAADVLPVRLPVNLADYAVAHYLRGGIAIPAEDFQSLLGLRSRVSESILAMEPGFGKGVALFLIAGFACFGLRLTVNFVRLHRMLAGCHLWRRNGRVRLLLSDLAPVPFSARGPCHHYVVIPSDLLAAPEDLALVLRHEFQHLRQGDVTWEIALECLRPLLFWNPFYYVWKSEVEQLRELACDQKVAEDARVDPRSYCMCLLRAAQAGLKKRQEQRTQDRSGGVASVALLEVHDRLLRRSPAQKLRRRVEALMEPDRLQPHRGILALAGLAMVSVIFLTALAIQKPADWSQDRLMLSAIVNLERLQIINTFGQRP